MADQYHTEEDVDNLREAFEQAVKFKEQMLSDYEKLKAAYTEVCGGCSVYDGDHGSDRERWW